jgi:ABC-type multidrug transport system fused ATPase/permease subunit
MNWQLALFILLLNPVVIYVTTVFGRRVKQLKRAENRAYQAFQESLAETLEAIQQIRAANRERHYVRRLIDDAAEIRRHAAPSPGRATRRAGYPSSSSCSASTCFVRSASSWSCTRT